MQEMHPYLKSLNKFAEIRYANSNNAKLRSLVGATTGAAFSFANLYSPFWGGAAVLGGAAAGYLAGECFDSLQAFDYIRENKATVDNRLYKLLIEGNVSIQSLHFTDDEITTIAQEITDNKLYNEKKYLIIEKYLPPAILEKVTAHRLPQYHRFQTP